MVGQDDHWVGVSCEERLMRKRVSQGDHMVVVTCKEEMFVKFEL
jgi:hypothetical protein